MHILSFPSLIIWSFWYPGREKKKKLRAYIDSRASVLPSEIKADCCALPNSVLAVSLRGPRGLANSPVCPVQYSRQPPYDLPERRQPFISCLRPKPWRMTSSGSVQCVQPVSGSCLVSPNVTANTERKAKEHVSRRRDQRSLAEEHSEGAVEQIKT